MVASKASSVVFRTVIPVLSLYACLASCQTVGTVPSAGPVPEAGSVPVATGSKSLQPGDLAAPVAVEALKVCLSLPQGWQPVTMEREARYLHQQWWSSSRRTAVGVTYIRMPLPLGTRTLIHYAMKHVVRQDPAGRLVRRWTDSVGREWFEAERDKLRMTGYVMTSGLDAWINYYAHSTAEGIPADLELGSRSLESILPLSARSVGVTASAVE